MLLLVVDGSIDSYDHQIHIVSQVLEDIKAGNKPSILVINKIDKMEEKELISLSNKSRDVVYISAKEKMNLDVLLEKIDYYAEKGSEIIEALIPYNNANLVSYMHRRGKIIEKKYKENGILVKGKFKSIVIGKIKEYLMK